jgi:hypothetical protein
MFTIDKPTTAPTKTKNELLLDFLTEYMDYSEEDAKDVLTSDFDRIKDMATRIRERLLEDKTLTVGFRAKVKELDFE